MAVFVTAYSAAFGLEKGCWGSEKSVKVLHIISITVVKKATCFRFVVV
jgi:hypothetical protein